MLRVRRGQRDKPRAGPGADRAYRLVQGGADQEPRGLRHAGSAHRPGCAGEHPSAARERGAGASEDLRHPLRQAGRRLPSPRRGGHRRGTRRRAGAPPDLRGPGRGETGCARADPRAGCGGARRGPPKPSGAALHERAGHRADHRARGRLRLRRRRPLPQLGERRRLSRVDAEALRVGRDQLQRPHLPARRQDDANPSLRGGERHHDAQAGRIAPARLGARDRRAHRTTEGQGRPGSEARRDPARDVAHGHAVPRRGSRLTRG